MEEELIEYAGFDAMDTVHNTVGSLIVRIAMRHG